MVFPWEAGTKGADGDGGIVTMPSRTRLPPSPEDHRMNRSEPTRSISASEVTRAAAALAEHLERSGVRWVPHPRPDAVGRIVETWGGTADESAAANAEPATTERASSRGGSGQRPSGRGGSEKPEPQKGASGKGASNAGASSGRLAPVAPVLVSGEPYPGEDLEPAERRSVLASMSEEVAGCTRCPALVACRKRTVFGEGSETPRVVFFGEGPGAEEDRSGRPFVGKAGQLLTKMIEACTFRREDVYIMNTVKCRPPANRNPEPQEVANCRDYFERQLAVLRPEYIVCLGAVSAQALLQSKLSVGRLRGNLHRYFDSKVIVTYHPAYLLRTPAAKKAAWEDLQMMLRDAGIDPTCR